jgi:hypothetical protein
VDPSDIYDEWIRKGWHAFINSDPTHGTLEDMCIAVNNMLLTYMNNGHGVVFICNNQAHLVNQLFDLMGKYNGSIVMVYSSMVVDILTLLYAVGAPDPKTYHYIRKRDARKISECGQHGVSGHAGYDAALNLEAFYYLIDDIRKQTYVV